MSTAVPRCACGCGRRPKLFGSRFVQGHAARRQYPSFADRFEHRVKRTDTCWLWQGRPDATSGYARLRVGRIKVGVHVIAWKMANNRPVPKGYVICHSCDEKLCVRPTHLFAGTQAENIADRDQKGHTAKGVKNAAAKLTEAQVLEIRRRRNVPRARMARDFGVSVSTIKQIRSGRIWRHLLKGAA